MFHTLTTHVYEAHTKLMKKTKKVSPQDQIARNCSHLVFDNIYLLTAVLIKQYLYYFCKA